MTFYAETTEGARDVLRACFALYPGKGVRLTVRGNGWMIRVEA